VNNQIDIVIPVYNGYEDVQMCLESIKKYTNLQKHRVLLVNDKSPDERILPFLESQVAENIVLINNEENLGFSGSINKGIEYGKNDVILLNSDTIVTKNWVEKIIATAYREENIATVTPLSNSGTLCSVPVICTDNAMPSNVTIDEYAEIIEKSSLKRYSIIPVAVGFCMYIKRNVLQEVGLFDAETFGRGYGEENDFCHRAQQLGYHHVMCDDTFIYHKGTASFPSEERRLLTEAHLAILQKRYPEQNKAIEKYCMRNPEQGIRDNINLYMLSRNGKKNILYLLQSDFRADAENHLGGTQFHVKDLALNLKDSYNVFVMARDGEYLNLTLYTEQDSISFKFFIDVQPPYHVFYDKKYEEIFEAVLEGYAIDYVHIHHTLGLSLDLFQVAHRKEIPLYVTIHDYFYINSNIKLYETQEMKQKKKIASKCTSSEEIIKKWQRENYKALSLCDKVIYPSNRAKEIFISHFKGLEEKSVVIEHGRDNAYAVPQEDIKNIEKTSRVKTNIDFLYTKSENKNLVVGWSYLENVDNNLVNAYVKVEDGAGKIRYYSAQKMDREDIAQLGGSAWYLQTGFQVNANKLAFASGKLKVWVVLEYEDKFYTSPKYWTYQNTEKRLVQRDINVAFIGAMVEEKGSEIVKEAIKKQTENINWFVIGAASKEQDFKFEQDNMYHLGSYNRDEIFNILEDLKIDLVCILPQWAETFCYTLSEAWMCKIPVIVTDIGAVADRVKETGAGFVVPVDVLAEDLNNLIIQIKDNRNLLEVTKAKVTADIVKSVPEMIGEYKEFYNNTNNKKREMGVFDSQKIFKAHHFTNICASAEQKHSPQLRQQKRNYTLLMKKGIRYLKKNGVRETIKRTVAKLTGADFKEIDYGTWRLRYLPKQKELQRQRKTVFAYAPKFSIVVPCNQTSEHHLKEFMTSIEHQTYSNWEVLQADGSGIEKTNEAIKRATGDFLVFAKGSDLLSAAALFECVKALNEKPQTEIIYTDEDKVTMDSGTYFQPHFKPDFSIDFLRSMNYISHMLVVKKQLADEIGELNPAFDGAEEYDFILRCIENSEHIYHIPKVLYHSRADKDSDMKDLEREMYVSEAAKKAIEAHYKRVEMQVEVVQGDCFGKYRTKYVIAKEPLISIIIPNKDHIEDLKKCIASIERVDTYQNYEYIIVENNSTKESTFAYYKELEATNKKVTVVYYKDDFNYSLINNFGVQYAKGEYVLLLNNDTEIINKDCLSELVGYCMRGDVGVVGARLYYEDDTIQHAGTIIGFGGVAGHAYVGFERSQNREFSRIICAQNYSAVTAACLMVKKSIYEAVGGLTPEFKVAFNDVDFCLKVREYGKLVVYNPYAELYHYESKSRGMEDTPEKVKRFNNEIELFRGKWEKILQDGDPYYNSNLTLDKNDFSLK
jgi:Predicted glycosyltransferases